MNESPARFRKKPVEIKAMQWTADYVGYDICDWADGGVKYDPETSGPSDPETGNDWGRLEIETLEGPLVATPRDWIIRGIKGEFYPCKPDIFAATYEAAPQPLELSEVERVAVEHTEHMSTCHEPACVDCMRELRAIRRTIKAVEPVIAKRARAAVAAALAERLTAKALIEVPAGVPAGVLGHYLAIEAMHLTLGHDGEAQVCNGCNLAVVEIRAALTDQPATAGEPEAVTQQ